MSAETIERLRTVIGGALGAKAPLDIAATAPLQQVVKSSLQFIVIIGEIERAFGVVVPDSELALDVFRDLDSVAGLVDRLLIAAA